MLDGGEHRRVHSHEIGAARRDPQTLHHRTDANLINFGSANGEPTLQEFDNAIMTCTHSPTPTRSAGGENGRSLTL